MGKLGRGGALDLGPEEFLALQDDRTDEMTQNDSHCIDGSDGGQVWVKIKRGKGVKKRTIDV